MCSVLAKAGPGWKKLRRRRRTATRASNFIASFSFFVCIVFPSGSNQYIFLHSKIEEAKTAGGVEIKANLAFVRTKEKLHFLEQEDEQTINGPCGLRKDKIFLKEKTPTVQHCFSGNFFSACRR